MNIVRGFLFTLLGAMIIAPVAVAQVFLSDSANWTLKPHEANRDQFTLAIPDGWFVVDQTPYRETGVIAFYSRPMVMRLDDDALIREQQTREMIATAEAQMSGELPAFFMDRYKASKGMSCSGYTEQGIKRKLKIAANAPALSRGARVIGMPETREINFAGCKGLRINMRIAQPDRNPLQMLVYTAAANDISYDFVLLTEARYFDQNLAWFERVIGTAKLTAASNN